MLRGMGLDNNTSVYVAAGKIYKADKYMAPLKQLFPLLETKETLATPEELAPFQVLSYCCSYSTFLRNEQCGKHNGFITGPLIKISSS